jgi:hypothetical protein
MKHLYTLIICILFTSTICLASNTLYISEGNGMTIKANGSGTLTIGTDAESFYAIQFDIILPKGFTVTTNSDAAVVTTTNMLLQHSTTEGATKELTDGSIRYRIIAYSSSLITSTGDLCQITINNLSANAGETYTGQINNAYIANSSYAKKETTSTSFSIKTEAEDFIELDETNTATLSSESGKRVHIIRTIPASQWNTLYLPFSMTSAEIASAFGSDVKLATFDTWEFEGTQDAVTSLKMNFNTYDYSSSGIEACKPYLIYTTKKITEFTTTEKKTTKYDANSSSIGYTPTSSSTYYAYFTGKYEKSYLSKGQIFLSGNNFYIASGSTTVIKGFRAFFNLNSITFTTSSSAKVSLYVDDEKETTGIKDLTKTEETNNSRIYNIAGQYVGQSEETLQPGVYIKNGKKIYIK